MKINVLNADVTTIEGHALLVNLFEGVEKPGGATGAVDDMLGGIISRLIAEGEIKGKFSEITLIHTLGSMLVERVVVLGLGKQHELTLDRIRQVTAEGCRFLRKRGVRKITTVVHGAGIGGIEPAIAAKAVVEGSILGLYSFNKHKTAGEKPQEVEELSLVEKEMEKIPALEEGCAIGEIMAEVTCLARDAVNEPANLMTPGDLAELARNMALDEKLGFTVLEEEQMHKLGMGALLGVARGSKQPPKLIILRYSGNPSVEGAVGLVGKGITFDSGGISIKPSESMWEMKGDMSGAAAVIAAMRGIARIKPQINVTALIPATENLPSGNALKPGDVLQAMNGKTIEIISTDAEGRLILADALCYARQQALSPIIDIATLTGACHIALGDICSGVFGSNPELVSRVISAGEQAGERLWQLPLYEEYKEQNKSEVADVKNTGGRYGGAITAAQFLAEFVEDTPWVHLDIAGTFLSDKEKGYRVKGATGVGVGTLVNLVISLAQAHTQA